MGDLRALVTVMMTFPTIETHEQQHPSLSYTKKKKLNYSMTPKLSKTSSMITVATIKAEM